MKEDPFLISLSAMREEMKQKYNRVLPTGELLFNRFDKAQYLGAGKNSSIYDTSVIMGNVIIGEDVWIGPYTVLESINGKLTIGNFVSINAGVTIYTHDSTKYYLSNGKVPFSKGDVTIGDNSVIATMSMICPGVKIGNRCVVAAYSKVSIDLPDNTIAAGVPAKIIGTVRIVEGDVIFEYNQV